MALGAGEGAAELHKATTASYVRPRQILNRFSYIKPRAINPTDVTSEPNGVSPLALVQPAVPITRAQKERVECATLYVKTAADIAAPPPPTRPRVRWPQSQAQSPIALTASRSRMSMLSEKLARG